MIAKRIVLRIFIRSSDSSIVFAAFRQIQGLSQHSLDWLGGRVTGKRSNPAAKLEDVRKCLMEFEFRAPFTFSGGVAGKEYPATRRFFG